MLHVLIIATRRERYTPCFLASCKRVGIAPVILGRGRRQLPGRIFGSFNDQRWWTNRLLVDSDGICLDGRCEIFQTLFSSVLDLEIGARLKNRLTGTRPSVLHGNGQLDMSPILERLRIL